MIFASHLFLDLFLPLFLLAYYASPPRLRTLTLAVASYVFYGWWRPDFVVLMLISTLVDFFCGQRIVAARQQGASGKPFLLASLITNLGLLAYFKYANFAVDTWNGLRLAAGFEAVPWVEVVLPVGISFYTFQSLSYTVDLYRGRSEPVQRFTDFACYVAMFPQLIAGPIVRYHTFAAQLRERRHDLPTFARGVMAFQIGLVKKVLVADSLAPWADAAFGGEVGGAVDAWLGLLAYAFQIYFDFSGYSDMAIGLGLMVGFRLPINFARPYAAISVTDFWRRWHISLSAFLRDYLYIPLGGNRKGPRRTYINLLATMLLGGLWHGAQWTFVAWGAFHGAWLALERWLGRGGPEPTGMRRKGRIALTFVGVLIGWVFFRAPDFASAGDYLWRLAGGEGVMAGFWLARWKQQGMGLMLAGLIVWGMPTTQEWVQRKSTAFFIFLQLAFVVALLHLHYQGHAPFLYYQF